MNSSIRDMVMTMRHSPAHNYVIPGLTSWLIGTPHPDMGCVRLFTMGRYHEEPIIPHSHRFNFTCLVLHGEVRNILWKEVDQHHGDPYEISDVTYEGSLGLHHTTRVGRANFTRSETVYREGDKYGMDAEEFHSIFFSKGAEVLFFEGPARLKRSQILEPIVDDMAIPLFRTEPWMFRTK